MKKISILAALALGAALIFSGCDTDAVTEAISELTGSTTEDTTTDETTDETTDDETTDDETTTDETAEEEETVTELYSGSETLSWSGTNNFNANMEMPAVSEGDKIVITTTIDDTSYTNIALITYDSSWNWVILDGFVDETGAAAYASVDDDGTYTYTLTADDATNIAVQNALAIQGANITVTKVELVQ